MKLADIILEKQEQNEFYERLITDTNVKFWTTLAENAMLPLSESAQQNNIREMQALLYETAFKLPDNQRDRFFDEILNNPLLDESWLGDKAKAAGNLALDGLSALDKGKQVVVDTAKTGIKKAASGVASLYSKYIPDNVKEKIASMGKAAIEAVKKGIDNLNKAANMIINKIAEIKKKYIKEDPCLTVTESLAVLDTLLEAMENQYFVDTKKDLLNKFSSDLQNLPGGLPEHIAKTVSLLKLEGNTVFGKDVRPIAFDITKNGLGGVNSNEATQIITKGLNDNKYFPMSRYFKENQIKSLIMKFDAELSPQNEEPTENKPGNNLEKTKKNCDMDPVERRTMAEKYLGPDSQAGKALAKLGMQEIAQGIIEEINNHPGSFLIAVASAVITIMSGAGALRIAAVVFGSVLPSLGNAYVEYLKKNNKSEETIAFAEKVVSAVRGIATIAQIINIASLVEKGWALMADEPVKAPQLPSDEVVKGAAEKVVAVSHEMKDLSPNAQEVLSAWTQDDGNLELSPKTVSNFFDKVSEHMTPEQFKDFDELVIAAKGDPEKYQELIKVLDNPTSNGIIDVDLENYSKIADATVTTAPMDLSSEHSFTVKSFLDKADISYDDWDSFKDEAMSDYATEKLGVNSFRTIQGVPMTDDEYAEFLKAVPTYEDNPLSKEALNYLHADKFQERANAITKLAIQKAAEENNIALADDFEIVQSDAAVNEPSYSTTDTGTSMFSTAELNDLGIDQNIINKVGTKHAQEFAEMVRNGQVDSSEIKQYIDSMESAGITDKDKIFNGVNKAIEQANAAPIEDIDGTTSDNNTLPNNIKAVGQTLQQSEVMNTIDNDLIKNDVANKIMNDYKSNPEFAKAWDSQGFDREGYIEKLASNEGWFKPLDQTELVKDLKAGGVSDPETAKRIGTHIQNSYDKSSEFRAKWNGMTDDQQKDYIAKMKAKIDEFTAMENAAKTIVENEPKFADLDSATRMYVDGLIKTDQNLIDNWGNLDDAAKDELIAKAEAAKKVQNSLGLGGVSKAYKYGLNPMNGNDYMELGKVVADYDPDTQTKLLKAMNLNYGENSILFRKALEKARVQGTGAVKELFDALRDGDMDSVKKMAKA